MDRSFLSQTAVIEASRKLVCIRLATYENAQEAKMLAGIFSGGSGQLENTVFAILAPDGTTPLVRSGRAPHQFRDAADLAETMKILSRDYKSKTLPSGAPLVENLRLALNVAACDHLPVVVSYAQTRARQSELSQQLGPLAWDSDLQGQAIYCQASPAELRRYRLTDSEGYLVLGPDEFGQSGTLLANFASLPTSVQLSAGLARYQPGHLTAQQHIRQGHKQGVRWETRVPVTDPHGKY